MASSKNVKKTLPKISFVWKRPTIDGGIVVVNAKLFVFVFCSLVSSFVNLIFVASLTRSPYTIGTLISVPGAILLGFLSIGLDLSKALHVIQVNTLGELYQEVKGRYAWSGKIRRLKNRWFTVYILYVILSIITSVSLSSISIGSGITRNANNIKQIDSAISQGEKYYNISDTTQDMSLQGAIKQATDTTEEDAVSQARKAWVSIEPLLSSYQDERREFEKTYGTSGVNRLDSVEWQGDDIIPSEYWLGRNNELASKAQSLGYTGRVSGPALKVLSQSAFENNVKMNIISARDISKSQAALEKLSNVNDITMQEAYNWVLELNNTQFFNPKTHEEVEFDDDSSKPVKVLVNSALIRLKALRVDVENDSGDIGSSSKIFMQLGAFIDGMRAKKNKSSDLNDALETKISGSFGTTEVMMMMMLLFLSLLCELAINQFSPKTVISRKMLSQFAKYFPSDFDVDDFMLGVLIRQLKYGDISKEKFEKLSEQTAMMSRISKESLMEKYSLGNSLKEENMHLKEKIKEMKGGKFLNPSSVSSLREAISSAKELI